MLLSALLFVLQSVDLLLHLLKLVLDLPALVLLNMQLILQVVPLLKQETYHGLVLLPFGLQGWLRELDGLRCTHGLPCLDLKLIILLIDVGQVRVQE